MQTPRYSQISTEALFTAPMIAVRMQGPIRCMAVRLLYPQGMQTLSPFECARNDGVLPVIFTPLDEAWTRILVFCIMPASLYLLPCPLCETCPPCSLEAT
jgi:hypothetical protein